jgi:hypothetical protein
MFTRGSACRSALGASSGASRARPTQQAKEDQPGSDPPLPVEKLIPQVSSDSSGAPG